MRLNKINKEFGLTCEDGIVTTTSLKVAEIYGKQHKHVMEKIRGFIDLIPEINGSNFRLVDYDDNKGEKRPMYIIDRQGFFMLVNKFTGDEATIFTYKYSQAFEHLIELVKQLQEENEDLYQIAVSDNCQLERQYDADKIKYAIRNISNVLSSVKYTELEDTINKIIDVHTHLRKKDRYEYHRNLNATEYKKKSWRLLTKSLMLYY